MEMLDSIILNIVLVLFPILVYFVYTCYIAVNNKKNKDIAFELLIFTSLYLCLKYGNGINQNGLLLFSNIPILVAYLKRKDKLAVFLSLFTILYCYYTFEINMIFIIIKHFSYFIIFYICKKKQIDNSSFIVLTSSFQAFFLSFIYYYNLEKIGLIFNVVWLILIFLTSSIFILYLFETMEKLSNISISIKELEKDKQIKNSLFKLTHEIKNPLAVCKGYLEMINLENKDKSKKYIEIIKQEIERSLLIMADFSELNKIKINKELVDINYLIEEIYNSLNLLTNSKNIKMTFTNKEELYLNIDYNKIKQVLINIIKNSIESIENSGIIEINTYKKNKNFYIEIKDNGIGMDKETLERLKEMFFTTKKNGTGLGVALSNEIIKAHNGSLKYQSKVNEGTKVTIKLPLK